MITQEKIKIYKRFGGDIDGWIRIGSKEEKDIMDDDDWPMISSLLQDILLVKRQLASPEFAAVLQSRLAENCDHPETISQLKKIVDNQEN